MIDVKSPSVHPWDITDRNPFVVVVPSSPSDYLTQEEYEILRDLVELRATTPIRFEIRKNRIGQNVKAKLDGLKERGWVQSRLSSNSPREQIYVPTLDAVRFVTRTERSTRKKR